MSFLLRHSSLKLGMVFVVVTFNTAGLGPLGVSSPASGPEVHPSRLGTGLWCAPSAIALTCTFFSGLWGWTDLVLTERCCWSCAVSPCLAALCLLQEHHHWQLLPMSAATRGWVGRRWENGETCFLFLFCFLNTFACCQGLWAYL